MASSSPLASRLSQLGYSGEHFDAKAQQQYLRARFYNPANSRFNRLDPFAGNMQDPQSLHKYAYVHGDPVQGVDPTGLFNVPAMAVRIGIGVALGATGAVGFNAVRNHAIAMPLFHGWKQAFLAGAIIGGAGVVSPWIYYLVSGLAVADSLAVAADTIQDPNASWDQVVASISLVAISGLALGGSRAYAGRFGKISEGLGGSRWYSIRIPSRPLGTKLVVPRGPNEAYFEYLAWSTQRPTAQIRGQLRPGETPTPSEHQVSAGGLFEIPVSLFGKRFLYNIDETGVGAIVRNPDVGSPGRTGHPFFGNTSKAAGEVIFQGRRVIINDSTGRGRRDLTLAQRFFESLGYEVETRSWRGAEFGDNYGHNGTVPLNPPGT
ncbi:RHS repeat-associated core domain-containing protein [Roseiconus lacunae]|uniref:RHS repeat-associated core domain-containing protein n=1 Tax=Roseiconus lacunae TaxID=2605694 RepID=UPI0036F279AB